MKDHGLCGAGRANRLNGVYRLCHPCFGIKTLKNRKFDLLVLNW